MVHRRLWVLLFLLSSIVVDSGLAAPARMGEQLRTASCCVRNCRHATAVACAANCCRPSGDRDAAVSSEAKSRFAPPIPAGDVAPRGFTVPQPAQYTGVETSPSGDGMPPVFLLTRTLRL